MNAIRIHKHLDSESMTLPELKPLVGKDVEIIVLEESAGKNRLIPDAEELVRANRLSPAERRAVWKQIGPVDVDEDAIRKLRDASTL